MKITLIVMSTLCGLTIISCSSYLPTNYYLIETDPVLSRAEKRFPLTVGVGKIRSPSRYREPIVYRTSDFDVGFYEYSKWVEPPDEMVRRTLFNALKSRGLFRQVEYADVALATDLSLNGEIVSFDQVVEGGRTYAECELSLTLADSRTSAPLWSYTALAEQRQPKEGEFAAAMSAAAAAAIENALLDLEGSPALSDYRPAVRAPAEMVKE